MARFRMGHVGKLTEPRLLWQSAKNEIFMAAMINLALCVKCEKFEAEQRRMVELGRSRQGEFDAVGAWSPGGWFP